MVRQSVLLMGLMATATVAFGLSLGCAGGESRPSVELEGVVTLDGEPLPAGSIQFTSTKTGEAAYTNLDAGGHYQIEFPQADIGSEYEVTVGPPQDADLDATAIVENPPEQVADLVPMKYRDRTTSGLSVVIETEGKNTFDFALTSK